MKKSGIYAFPPNPYKKGGPPSSMENCKRDGEVSEEYFVQETPQIKVLKSRVKKKKK